MELGVKTNGGTGRCRRSSTPERGRARPSGFEGPDGWVGAAHEDETGARFRDHVEHLVEAIDGALDPPLGAPPTDLVRATSELALAGPGVCVLRALRRVAPALQSDDRALLVAASRGAAGFRTLFNMPESIGLLRGEDPDTPYWRLALRHGIDGNLQAVLDEHVHVLQESLGLIEVEPERRVTVTARGDRGRALYPHCSGSRRRVPA